MPRNKKTQDGKQSHALMYTLIILLVLAVWLAIFAFAIKLDMFGVGRTLRPVLQDVPVLNLVLPELSDAEIAEENNYPYSSLKDAIERIKELENLLSQEQDSTTDAESKIASLKAEIERLKVFEDNQLAFEKRVEEFDEKVVFSDDAIDIEEYKKYYEEINPDNAAKIYEKVVKQLQYDKSILDHVERFRKMKPKDAAAVLQEMTGDTESVAKILKSMESKYSSLILAEMDPVYAAKITKKILDMDAEMLENMQ